MEVDVTRAESVDALAERVFAKYGNVHLLFNNAGVGIKEAKRRIWTIPEKDWQWTYSVNVIGVTNGIRAFVPTMLERGEEGHVINTSSGNGGIASLPTTPVYASSKAAVTSLTEVLHFQFLMDDAKLQAHVLFPGPYLVNTNILNSDRVRPDAFRIEGQAPATYVDMKALAESAGVEFKLTEPEEVADMAIEGIRDGRFWILSKLGKSDERLRARTQSILERENPEPTQ
jgi:NAD(P)-dependent dehydrogenase (short-subunit alcohol dehydrogenase family)